MGDGLLAEFPSAVQDLQAAIGIHERIRARNAQLPDRERIEVRIGVHQGDVVVEGHDLLGDGVNIASRLEALAEPGGICLSARVYEDAAGKIAIDADDIGEQTLKNITRPTHVFRLSVGGLPKSREAKAATSPPVLVARQALDRGAALSEHERRPGAGIFRRRHGRGDHDLACAYSIVLRHRPQFELYL
jgi:adenylate cyclase